MWLVPMRPAAGWLGTSLPRHPAFIAPNEFDRLHEANHMNYPLLPADAAAFAWQLACCGVTLLFAMFSWMIGPR